MEYQPQLTIEDEIKLIESKDYKFKLNDNIYLLTMNLYSKTIEFLIIQINISSILNFNKEFEYEELINKEFPNRKEYDNISKIYYYYDKLITENKINFLKNQTNLILSLKTNNNNQIRIVLNLNEKKDSINNNEIIYTLFNELIELKSTVKDIIKEKLERKSIIKGLIGENNNLKKQNVSLENNIKLLLDNNFSFISKMDIYKQYLDEKINEYKKENEKKN